MKLKQTLPRIRELLSPVEADRTLGEMLSVLEPQAPLEDRMYFLEQLVMWIKKAETTEGKQTRVRMLLNRIENNTAICDRLKEIVDSTLRDCSFFRLLLQTGLSHEHGFFTEVMSRLMNKLIPHIHEWDMLDLVTSICADEDDDDMEWLRTLPDDLIRRLAVVIDVEAARSRIRSDAHRALIVFGTHVAHYSMTAEIRLRSPSVDVNKSPFIELQRGVLQLTPAVDQNYDSILEQLKLAKVEIDQIYQITENHGVSISLVTRLELLSNLIERMGETIAYLKFGLKENALIAERVDAVIRSQGLSGYLNQHLHLLARKVTESNSESGKHYVGRNREDFKDFLKSGIGGGVIVVFMTILKHLVAQVHPAPLAYAGAIWIIYAAGFLLMQFTGMTLATKLPSFTANHLVKLMANTKGHDKFEEFSREVSMILKSQIFSFVGNLVGLIPVAIVFDLIYSSIFQNHFMSPEYATGIFMELHPVLSGAVVLGALTGVLLWLSSLAGGWLENWVLYKNIPETILRHRRLKRIIGGDSTKKLSEFVITHASGVGANISLGFLFAFSTFLGSIIGIGIDSKHVTISSSRLVFAVSTQWNDPSFLHSLIWSLVGLFLILIMNLGVSFFLALLLAIRASAVSQRRFFSLLRVTLRYLLDSK